MKLTDNKLGTVAQNIILGSVMGIVVGYNLRLLFLRIGATDLAWILFLILGPLIGYLSGKERERIENLKQEKLALSKNLSKIQDDLKRSTKKYRLLVENANDAIFLTTLDGSFLLFNEATCLLSGYQRNLLKNMNLIQLLVDEKAGKKEIKTLLDNRVYRYEERWRKMNGDIVFLDINAKCVQFEGYKLILYVARNMFHQKKSDNDKRAGEIQRFQKKKVMEMVLAHGAFYKQIVEPLTNMVSVIQYFMKEYPDEEDKLSEVISELDKMGKLFRQLTSKNARDLNSSPSKWNLNKILSEELNYLKTVTDSKDLIIQTSFASNMLLVRGIGIDFSVAFGTVFRVILESLMTSSSKQLFVSTLLMNDNILVEIKASTSDSFEKYLSEILDLHFESCDSYNLGSVGIGLLICQMFFESFGAKFDVGYQQGKWTIVRIRVPVTEEEEEEIEEEVSVEQSEDLLVVS